MKKYFFVFCTFLVLGMSSAQAGEPTFILQLEDVQHMGWASEEQCGATGAPKCEAAYFCSQNIWISAEVMAHVQEGRYAGQKLFIYKNSQPLCAVD